MKEFLSLILFMQLVLLSGNSCLAQNSIIKYLESEKVSAFDFGCHKVETYLGVKLDKTKLTYALDSLLLGFVYDPVRDRFTVEAVPVSHSSTPTVAKTICQELIKEIKTNLLVDAETGRPMLNTQQSGLLGFFKGQGTPIREPKNAGKELDKLTDVKCSYLFRDQAGGPRLVCESHLLDPKILCDH